MISLMLNAYSRPEKELLLKAVRDALQQIDYNCQGVVLQCPVCPCRHYCDDMNSVEVYLTRLLEESTN